MNQLSKRRNSHEVRDKLVSDNMGFVYWMAKKYSPFADHDDLVQAGFDGLLEAASRYDASKGKFTCYALWWVKKKMMAISCQQHPIRVPSHKMTKIKKDELVYHADEVWWQGMRDYRLSPAKQMETKSTNDFLHRSVALLTPKQQCVIKLRFGLNSQTSLTLDQVGEVMGLSRERIRQIQVESLKYLREVMA